MDQNNFANDTFEFNLDLFASGGVNVPMPQGQEMLGGQIRTESQNIRERTQVMGSRNVGATTLGAIPENATIE